MHVEIGAVIAEVLRAGNRLDRANLGIFFVYFQAFIEMTPPCATV